MTETPIPTGKITEIVEQACSHYKKSLGGVGDPVHQDTRQLHYLLSPAALLLELSYVSMLSRKAFSFSDRINTKLFIDGERVTKTQLQAY